ncbi:ribonuclease HII [Bacteroidales bacterium KA00251]|nr:ribonuclease HII [Bacteroidales bacterium KA00251]
MTPKGTNPQLAYYAVSYNLAEAGCDEAGRGCLAGNVFAAAVILNPSSPIEGLNDSKKLSPRQRESLRKEIEAKSKAYAIGVASVEEIDQINILNASFLAMHRAIESLALSPSFLLIDGNRFTPYKDIPFQCFIKGDARFQSIAAASILAKTHRDEYMLNLHKEYPQYEWNNNKGYPTRKHIEAIQKYGLTPYHRKTFTHHLLVPSLFIT